MHTHLPIIASAGLFHSQDKFSDLQKYPQGATTRLRTVNDYEIELFTQDGGTTHINGKTYPIHKGDALIARPGDKRQSTLHFSALFVHFGTDDPAIQELLHTIGGFHTGLNYEKLEPLFTDICETALTFAPDSDILAAAKLLTLLCTIKKDCFMVPAATPADYHRSVISVAVEYMRRNYAEPLTVEQIAEHCSLSASYFYKLFLGTVHTTPYNYLLVLRLSAAKSLLVNTDLSVSEIAARCGFNSQAYFSDCFKKQTGLTPSRFRNSFSYPQGQ